MAVSVANGSTSQARMIPRTVPASRPNTSRNAFSSDTQAESSRADSPSARRIANSVTRSLEVTVALTRKPIEAKASAASAPSASAPMIPSETGSLASDFASDARPTTSVAAIGAARRAVSTAVALAGSTFSHHSFVVRSWPVPARRACSSEVASTIANGFAGSSEGNWGVAPIIESVSGWPEIETATVSPTFAALRSRNVWPTTAGRASGSVGVVDDRNSDPPPSPKMGSVWPSSKPNEIRFGEPGGGRKATADPKRIAVQWNPSVDGFQPMSRQSASPVGESLASTPRTSRVPIPAMSGGIRNDSSTPSSFAGPGYATRCPSRSAVSGTSIRWVAPVIRPAVVPSTLWSRPSPSSRSSVTSIPRQSAGITGAGVGEASGASGSWVTVGSAAMAASTTSGESERAALDGYGLRRRSLCGELLEERRQRRRGGGVRVVHELRRGRRVEREQLAAPDRPAAVERAADDRGRRLDAVDRPGRRPHRP